MSNFTAMRKNNSYLTQYSKHLLNPYLFTVFATRKIVLNNLGTHRYLFKNSGQRPLLH